MSEADITSTPTAVYSPHLSVSPPGSVVDSSPSPGRSPVSSDSTLADEGKGFEDDVSYEDEESTTPTLTRASTAVASAPPSASKQAGPWFQSASTGSTYALGNAGRWESTQSPSTPTPASTTTPARLVPMPLPRRRYPPAFYNAVVAGDWFEYLHLNGGVYHAKGFGVRIVTDIDLYDVLEMTRLDDVLSRSTWAVRMIPETDLEYFITLADDDSFDVRVIDHGRGESYPAFLATYNSNVSNDYKRQYWYYLQRCPVHRRNLPPGAETDFVCALTHGAAERIFEEKDTTFPFTDHQAERFLAIYRDLQSSNKFGHMPALTYHVARIMYEIEGVRMRYQHGTHHARFHRDVAVPARTWKVRVADGALLLLVFGAHKIYRQRLQSTRVKGMLYLPDFQALMKSFLVEWADSNLLATVFVSSNVAFLAIANITPLQKAASLTSSLFALMSMATGVHHVWQHRGKVEADAVEAAKYLNHTKRAPAIQLGAVSSEHDLTLTALFLCLPLAALMWSIFAFAFAASAFCVQNAAGVPRIFLCAIIGIIVLASAATVAFFWNIWVTPPTTEPKDLEGSTTLTPRATALAHLRACGVLQMVHAWGSRSGGFVLRAWGRIQMTAPDIARGLLGRWIARAVPDVELAERAPVASRPPGDATAVGTADLEQEGLSAQGQPSQNPVQL